MYSVDSIIEKLVEKFAELKDKVQITKEPDGVAVRFMDTAMVQDQDMANPFSPQRLAGLRMLMPGTAGLDFQAEPMDGGIKLKTQDPDSVREFISKLLDPEAVVRILRQAIPGSSVKSTKERRAIEELRRVTDEQPNNFDAWYELGDLYLQVNELDDAEDCLHKIGGLMPMDPSDSKFSRVLAITGRYVLLRRPDDPDECVTYNLVAVAFNTQEPSAWNDLGAAFMLGNEPGLALRAFEMAGALGFKDVDELAKAKKKAREKLGIASYGHDPKKAKADIDRRVEEMRKQTLADIDSAIAYEKAHRTRATRVSTTVVKPADK
nr:tetratricopeptide repeat protein [Candidatus Sigynarchaeum springense]